MVVSVSLVAIPLLASVGASRSHEGAEVRKWREITPIKNARPFDLFIATTVEGDSLNGDRIFDGDVVIIRLNFDLQEITPGRLVSVLTPAGHVLKHIYVTLDDHVRLVSSNERFPDLVFDIELVEVQGIVVRTERDF